MKKRFIVEITSAPATRWLYNDQEFARLIGEMIDPALCLTQGPRPRITVTLEDEPQQIPIHRRD